MHQSQTNLPDEQEKEVKAGHLFLSNNGRFALTRNSELKYAPKLKPNLLDEQEVGIEEH